MTEELTINIGQRELSRRLSDKESAGQCRRCESDP